LLKKDGDNSRLSLQTIIINDNYADNLLTIKYPGNVPYVNANTHKGLA
jgi:hypothetical protein